MLGLTTLLLWTLPTATVVLLISATVGFAMIAIHILAEIGRKADADNRVGEGADAAAAEVDGALADAAELEQTGVSS